MKEIEQFQEARQRFVQDADALQVPFFYFSPVNVVPKLWTEKLTIVKLGELFGLVDGQGGVRVIPGGSRGDYYAACVEAISRYKSVLLLPDWIAGHLASKKYKRTVQHREYMMATEAVQLHPGGANAAVRGNVNKARRLCTTTLFENGSLEEYLALNAVWYRQAAPTKFRTYDKVAIDTMLKRWDELAKLFPDAMCLGVRHAESCKLTSFNIGSKLTSEVWTAYTQRYDREGVKAANTLGYMQLADWFGATPRENDGTADTKEIRAWKDRLGAPSLAAYRIDR